MPTFLSRIAASVGAMTDSADFEASAGKAFAAINAKAALFGQGLLSNRPAAAIEGRIYWATDADGGRGRAYYDTGFAWRDVAPSRDVQEFTSSASIVATGGQNVRYSGASTGQTLTLPAAAIGLEFFVHNIGTVPVTIARGGTDVIGGATNTTIVLAPGAKVLLIAAAAGSWYPVWEAGEQVAAGHQTRPGEATGITGTGQNILTVTVVGDGVTPIKLDAGAQFLSVGGTMDAILMLRDEVPTQFNEDRASHHAGGTVTTLRPSTVVPAFTGSKRFHAHAVASLGSGTSLTMRGSAGRPATMRATWAPGHYTANP